MAFSQKTYVAFKICQNGGNKKPNKDIWYFPPLHCCRSPEFQEDSGPHLVLSYWHVGQKTSVISTCCTLCEGHSSSAENQGAWSLPKSQSEHQEAMSAESTENVL